MPELACKRNLFIAKLKEIYPENYLQIIDALSLSGYTTFRINCVKAAPESTLHQLKQQGFNIGAADLPNSYFIRDLGYTSPNPEIAKRLSNTPQYLNGEIYIQNLSSMLPVFALNAQPDDLLLDLCAAPGSKATQVYDLLAGKVSILAVENNINRFYALKRILYIQGAASVKTLYSDAVGLERKHPELQASFDRILVDVPCSNEGTIRLDVESSLKYWNPGVAKRLAKLQKALLLTGIRLLKPGGTLVYSTCTFSVEENELVINWLLNKTQEIMLEKISNLSLTNSYPGITSWRGKNLDPSLIKTLRILPTKQFSGFYLAKIRKSLDL